jgi:hypothetical protein
MSGTAHEVLLRLRALFRRARLDREMAEELEFHQIMLRDKLRRTGTADAEVDLAARLRFGNALR